MFCPPFTARHTRRLGFCTSSLTSHRIFDTRIIVFDEISTLVPDLSFLRLVTRVLGLASRPEGLSLVKAMKTEVSAGTLGSGQATRHNEWPAVFGDINGFSHVGLIRSRGCDIIIM